MGDYKIMFGPDICGYDVSRIHAIFNWDGENLLRTEDIKLSYDDKNKLTHLYTLVVKPDNTYEVFLDKKSKATGSLHDDWKFPPKTLDDPSDSKPSDWVDEAMLDDPEDKQPEDWDMRKKIDDPSATKPDNWDDDEEGEADPEREVRGERVLVRRHRLCRFRVVDRELGLDLRQHLRHGQPRQGVGARRRPLGEDQRGREGRAGRVRQSERSPASAGQRR